jgi:hypothetical protein
LNFFSTPINFERRASSFLSSMKVVKVYKISMNVPMIYEKIATPSMSRKLPNNLSELLLGQ